MEAKTGILKAMSFYAVKKVLPRRKQHHFVRVEENQIFIDPGGIGIVIGYIQALSFQWVHKAGYQMGFL